ncbi:hypothetical protein PC116_g29196 [Phytophthora cactorum]|uniref:Integrase-like, catalytic domain n=1 Tax=Phytophthora cactorum TaxID=29920 RepID=A0A329R5P3_9STRA|nr:hypothetical protein Pcac1_g26805 [Phytophthora cactorum]KAG2787258.1 hypothetical protein PC111_g24260 [Phytophthora cactorum]KAG2806222.1 hypothetical protein PC113_g24156 [Phytophthora cactorum]KAG2812426.1 hypothetical protein PC112_g15175 [Phytophthora cactorum]KAG2956440.1 hypothetical protein PC118_g24459 [Phytophthora cactorum]
MNRPGNIPAAVYMSRRGRLACISTEDISGAIKHAAIHTGKTSCRLSSHSLRTGGVTHVYRSDADALTIQCHCRWVSDAYKTYTRLCKESGTTLIVNMVAGSMGDSTLQ